MIPPATPDRRRAGRLLAALAASVLVVATLGGVASPGAAQTGGCSVLDPAGTECTIVDTPPPPAPGPGERSGPHVSAPRGPRFQRLNLLVPCDAASPGGWTPNTDLDAAIFDLATLIAAAPPDEPGVLWIMELVRPGVGPTNTGFITCVAAGDGPPPPPPPLPTAQQIWGEALTVEPGVNLDPYVRGLTGLETYAWYDGGQLSDSVTLTLNGYGVTATIQAVEFRWDMGGPSRTGETRHVTTHPGSADDPAATHVYAQPAPVVVVHETVWIGTATITGPGLPAGGIAVDLGQATLAAARAYEVIEVRTPLVAPGGGG